VKPAPKVLFLNYPHNPTSHTVESEFFAEVVAIAKKYALIVVHDFAYGQVCFDGYKAPSFLATPGALDVGVEFTSMSKTFNMAGWRIGYCAGNRKIIAALGAIKGYYDYGIFQAIQVASIIGLRDCSDLARKQASKYQERRDVLVTGLKRIGWGKIDAPRAGMFVWAPIPEPFRSLGSMEFARRLMEDAEVAVAPGIGFGPDGEGWIRLALVENGQRMQQAVRQMKRAFQKWPEGRIEARS
jgi:alanine-synthesizing transaminase